jgi:hypothetical protein
MKNLRFPLCLGLISLLAGCSTPSVVLAPVGPNPIGTGSMASTGSLEVFSRLAKQRDDQSQGGDGMPRWYQHTDYSIYDSQGNPVKRVGNSTGHYAEAPDQVTLPAGRYLVKAQAEDYSWIKVPVTIERGRTTGVHLDGKWKPPADAPKTAVVSMPNGYPVGWRADSSKALGIN